MIYSYVIIYMSISTNNLGDSVLFTPPYVYDMRPHSAM